MIHKYINGIPRKARMETWVPAERAIFDAMQVVEGVGAHPLLTDAVILLGQAQDKVAAFIDRKDEVEPDELPIEQREFPGIAAQLDAAPARIKEKELEAQAAIRPVTIRTMKADIAKAIGAQLSGGDYKYCCTVSRSDLEKIHAWVMKQQTFPGYSKVDES